MVSTHCNAAHGKGKGSRRGANNSRARQPPFPSSPTMEQSVAQFLESQLNLESLRHCMEEAMRNNVNNTHQGGNDVDQLSRTF